MSTRFSPVLTGVSPLPFVSTVGSPKILAFSNNNVGTMLLTPGALYGFIFVSYLIITFSEILTLSSSSINFVKKTYISLPH
jgi:hypothetical protein